MLKRLLVSISLLAFSPAFAQFEGNALDFDGTNDMVVSNTVPALFSNLATNSFTFEAWVNPRGNAFTRIFFAQPSTTNFATVSTSTGNVIYFYVIANGTTYSIATTAGIPQNQWTHVAARWNASTLTPQVLFNGVLQAAINGGTSSTGTSGLMTLGTRPGGAQYFNGALDEARIWSEHRTDCQIQANRNTSITGVQTNLVVNYVFNQGIAAGNNTGTTTLNDISGNGFNGTLTNFTLTSTTSNWITSGATVTQSGNPFNNFTRAQNMNVCSGGDLTFPDGSTQTNITTPFVQNSTVTGPVCDTVVSTTVSVNAPISRNDTAAICSGGSFTFADGSSQSNITSVVDYTSTLQTAGGCDSLVMEHVAILQPTSSSETVAVCPGGSHTFPDGSTLNNITSQVTYMSMIQNVAGCDSMVTTTVNVNPAYALSDSYSVCTGSSFTFADGSTQNNITSQVIYTSSLSTINGCDSAITTTVNVNPNYVQSDAYSVCTGSSFTFADGSTLNNITSQVVYTSTLSTINGCDSAITTTVNVNPTYALNNSFTVCAGSSFTFADGSTQNNITSQVVYTSTLSTINGCDSAITTTVMVDQPNTNVTGLNETLTATLTGATYQWLDCSNGFALLPGATNQSYTATANGSYAVSVTINGCTDTSNCFVISSVGINSPQENAFQIYPNPSHDIVNISTGDATTGTIELMDLSGKIIFSKTFTGSTTTIDLSAFANGVYFVNMYTDKGKSVARLVKE